MNDHDANIQRAKNVHIEEDVGEVFVGDDRAIDADDERLFAEARDVLENSAQISWFHRIEKLSAKA